MTELIGRFASVRSSMETPLVSFHDVELGARNTAILRLLSATVPIMVILEGAISVLSWHIGRVEGSDAAAGHLAQVNVVGDVAAE